MHHVHILSQFSSSVPVWKRQLALNYKHIPSPLCHRENLLLSTQTDLTGYSFMASRIAAKSHVPARKHTYVNTQHNLLRKTKHFVIHHFDSKSINIPRHQQWQRFALIFVAITKHSLCIFSTIKMHSHQKNVCL